MTWFKVDDSFYRSAKVRKLGRDRVACVGLWTLAGVWAADNLSDGFVPWEVVETWDRQRKLSTELITARLWVEAEHDGEQGVCFHDWHDWQPTKEQVTQRRKADAERRARWRAAKHNVKVTSAETEESREVSRRDATRESRPGSALPDPTRPDPTRTSFGSTTEEIPPVAVAPPPPGAKPKPKAHRLPDDFKITPEMVEWAQREVPHVDGRRETDNFRDYWAAAAGANARKLNWTAAWRTWMRNADKRGGPSRGQLSIIGGPTPTPQGTSSQRANAFLALRKGTGS